MLTELLGQLPRAWRLCVIAPGYRLTATEMSRLLNGHEASSALGIWCDFPNQGVNKGLFLLREGGAA